MQIRRNCFLQLPWFAETVNPKNFPTTMVGAKEEPPRRQGHLGGFISLPSRFLPSIEICSDRSRHEDANHEIHGSLPIPELEQGLQMTN